VIRGLRPCRPISASFAAEQIESAGQLVALQALRADCIQGCPWDAWRSRARLTSTKPCHCSMLNRRKMGLGVRLVACQTAQPPPTSQLEDRW
jgi:EAL domain-containing protein (putative c-di-GMP-specific phosphodiesterase class I)